MKLRTGWELSAEAGFRFAEGGIEWLDPDEFLNELELAREHASNKAAEEEKTLPRREKCKRFIRRIPRCILAFVMEYIVETSDGTASNFPSKLH